MYFDIMILKEVDVLNNQHVLFIVQIRCLVDMSLSK